MEGDLTDAVALRLLKDADLGACTTLRVGGSVERLLEPANPDELRAAIVRAKDEGFTPRVLGGGANLVIDDRGLPGLVSHRSDELRFRPMAPPSRRRGRRYRWTRSCRAPAWRRPIRRRSETGVGWSAPPKLCRAARDLGYSGLEKMAGVPGQVAVDAMNAGGKDPDGTLWQMSDVVEQIRVVNELGEFEDIDAEPGRRVPRRPAR